MQCISYIYYIYIDHVIRAWSIETAYHWTWGWEYKENTEIPYLRNKLSVSDAKIAELKHRNIKFLRTNKEYNERNDAENAKFRARIKKMEFKFGDRITKVE